MKDIYLLLTKSDTFISKAIYLMGLILCKLEVPYRRNHYYFCSEFVSEILAYSQAIELPKLPCLMKPSDYLLFEELECLYQGNIGELIKYRGLC